MFLLLGNAESYFITHNRQKMKEVLNRGLTLRKKYIMKKMLNARSICSVVAVSQATQLSMGYLQRNTNAYNMS